MRDREGLARPARERHVREAADAGRGTANELGLTSTNSSSPLASGGDVKAGVGSRRFWIMFRCRGAPHSSLPVRIGIACYFLGNVLRSELLNECVGLFVKQIQLSKLEVIKSPRHRPFNHCALRLPQRTGGRH